MAADFWGKGLGNSVNVALNALAFAVASNRTLLISDDARFRAGFWKYLGDVEARWALKSQIRKCGPEVVQDFFPMNRRCLEEKTCGTGIKWMLCDGRALSHSDAHIVHIRSAVTWLAPLLGENSALDPHIRRRLRILFPKGVNTWGKLYSTLLDPQPEEAPTSVNQIVACTPSTRSLLDSLFDLPTGADASAPFIDQGALNARVRPRLARAPPAVPAPGLRGPARG